MKCTKCGKWGLFLKLDSNQLCKSCAAIISHKDTDDNLKVLNQSYNNISKMYDLNSLEGINSIPIKSFEYDPQDGKTYAYHSIEYILQRKATEHKKNGRLDLAIACLKKSNQIMPISEIGYTSDDYLRLAKYLRLNKQFDEAHRVEEQYADLDSEEYNKSLHNKINSSQIKTTQSCESDLVHAVVSGYHCAECAKYIGRVYSITGKDKRFPKLPQYIKENGYHCNITLYPFWYGISTITDTYDTSKILSNDEIIQYSNRPYEDFRPQKYIDGYNELVAMNHKKEIAELNSKQAQIEYEEILMKLPDYAPKSQGGYLRMKKSNSENFQKIKNKAHEAGIDIKDLI